MRLKKRKTLPAASVVEPNPCRGHGASLLSLAGAATRIIFVATKVLFVATNIILRQITYFVATKVCYFCHDKSMLVLSRQKYASFVGTNICASFVATKDVFACVCRGKKKRYLWQLPPLVQVLPHSEHRFLAPSSKLPDLVTPLKGHSSSQPSWPPTRSAPSERFVERLWKQPIAQACT